MDLLEDVYDVDAECYRRGDTDDTVAEVLNVMPGWVAQIREDFFGPCGSNEEIAQLKAEIEEHLSSTEQFVKKTNDLVARLEKGIAVSRQYKARLDKIEAAVGPRVMARAK